MRPMLSSPFKTHETLLTSWWSVFTESLHYSLYFSFSF